MSLEKFPQYKSASAIRMFNEGLLFRAMHVGNGNIGRFDHT